MHEYFKKSAERYNANRHDIKFKIGEQILIKNPLKTGKLDKIWLGPYNIVEKHSEQLFVIERENGRNEIAHTERMKKFRQRN